MKVDIENISTVKKVLNVEIPEEDVTRELDKAYNSLKKNVRIKGFRPGKVPRSILERRFKNDVHAEVSGQLIQNSYVEAVKEANVTPVGEPEIEQPDLQEGKSYQYSATVEVPPSVEELNLEGFQLKEQVHTVTDEEIETQLKMIQKRSAQLKTVDEDRPAQSGDTVIIDYEGSKDGKPFEPARKTENFLIEVGSGRILEDFDQQVIGMHIDSTKEFDVTFPEDYYNKDLANQEVTFKVTLKEVKEEILPELDDEFAKDLGEYKTLAEVRDAIRKDLQRSYHTQTKRQLRKDIIDKLTEQVDFELPEVLVKEELSVLARETQNVLAERGMSKEGSGQIDDAFFEKYRPFAERKVQETLLLQKVIEQEEITLTDEALEEAYKELSEAMDQLVDSIKQFHNSYKDAYELFRQKALERQAIEHIVDNSVVEKVEAVKEEPQEEESEGAQPESA